MGWPFQREKERSASEVDMRDEHGCVVCELDKMIVVHES